MMGESPTRGDDHGSCWMLSITVVFKISGLQPSLFSTMVPYSHYRKHYKSYDEDGFVYNMSASIVDMLCYVQNKGHPLVAEKRSQLLQISSINNSS
jgi:hypothetical protein